MEIASGNDFCVFGYNDRGTVNDGKYLLKIDLNSDAQPIAKIYSNEKVLQEKLRSDIQKCSSIVEIGRLLVKDEHPKISESSFVGAVLQELESVGFERVAFLSENFTKVNLQYNSAVDRCHLMKITFNVSLPPTVIDVDAELPEKFQFDDSQSLTTLFESYVDFVDGFQEFWQEINTLDESDLISKHEDDVLGLASKTRRLILDKGVSVHLTINPKHPRALPEFSLSGPETSTASCKELIDSKLDLWNEENNVLENLLEIFGDITYSGGPTQRRNAIEAHCGICYVYESSKNEIPDQNCLQCKQQFHRSCLYEWLRKQANQRLSFGTVFGPCPYCSQTIKVKLSMF